MTDRQGVLELLKAILEAMLHDDENITARGAIRRMGGVLKNASDITRQPERRDQLVEYQQRQQHLRQVMGKADKQSKARLSEQIAKKDQEIAALTRQRDLLVASHRAMILAVGEMGGMAAWRRFFEEYRKGVQDLATIGALPAANTLLYPFEVADEV